MQTQIPKQCQCCGRQFSPKEAQILQSRQVFELPEPKLEVTEPRQGLVECCGILQCGEYPAEVTASVPYGPGVRALITKLSVEHQMPLKQISQLFEDMYGYEFNSATIEDILARGYSLVQTIENQNLASLREAATVHFDETGVRVEGQLHWLHTVSTPTHTHRFIHKQRGGDALNSEASMLKDFTGMAVHDCWSPYFNFNSARHVLCGAHRLRELVSLEENGSLWAGEMRELLLDWYQMSRPIPAREEVCQHYHTILEPAELEEPPPNPVNEESPKNPLGVTDLTGFENPRTGYSPLPWNRGFRSPITKRNGTYAPPR